MKGVDMYVKLIDPTGRFAPTVHYHRVWDQNRFHASLMLMHGPREGKDAADVRSVEVINKDEYDVRSK